MAEHSKLFDLQAAWRGLTPELQERIGMAAIALEITLAQDERTRGVGYQPGFMAAQNEAHDQITMAIGDAGLIAEDEAVDLAVPDLRVFGVRQCRECGCTDQFGCDEGCGWAEQDLCTSCVGKETPHG